MTTILRIVLLLGGIFYGVMGARFLFDPAGAAEGFALMEETPKKVSFWSRGGLGLGGAAPSQRPLQAGNFQVWPIRDVY